MNPDIEKLTLEEAVVAGAALAPSYAELADRYRPIFAKIAEGAVEREQNRELAHEAVNLLREAGFGALRIPRSQGGGGASLSQLFKLLVELGEADSNLPQILRAHLAFVELRLNNEDLAQQALWFQRIVDGALIGAAMAERTDATENTVKLSRDGEAWRLTGKKFYCTGTIYADWVSVAAADGEDRLSVMTPTTAEGVTRLDDWDGFGQRLTGSGTTVFENVLVPEENILRRFNLGEYRGDSYITAFYQQMHLAALAGIARAVLRDATEFVQAKTRTFGVPGQTTPRTDPLVQRVIGKLSSLAFAVEAIVDSVSTALDQAHLAWRAGARDESLYEIADIKAYQGQQVAIDLVLQATSLMFEVGGASATQEGRRLDRHWRNARTISSHNPAISRERLLGDHYLNGVSPRQEWADRWKKAAEPAAEPVPAQPEVA
jgi:alkylation response protein AidB-like acyl-CoA dehydrogenase